MTMRRPHTPESRERIAARLREVWADPEKRRLASEKAKAINNEPAMRAKIARRSLEGRLVAAGIGPALDALCIAWGAANPEVRRRFLDELMRPVIGESDVGSS